MTIFKCKMCGGGLEIKEGESVVVCEYCGTNRHCRNWTMNGVQTCTTVQIIIAGITILIKLPAFMNRY